MNDIDYEGLAAYLRDRWLVTQPYGWHRWSAVDIAAELFRDTAFTDIRLARWLQTPDGSMIMRVVENVLPFPYKQGTAVMAEAIKLAATRQTNRQVVVTLAVGAGLAVILLAASSN